MKLQPTSSPEYPLYPAMDQYARDRRMFLRNMGRFIAGVGFCAVINAAAASGDEEEDESDVLEKKYGKMVAVLCTQLGDKEFATRKKATTRLIELGKGCGENEHENAVARSVVLEKVEAIEKDDDPEVAARAKAVILALTKKVEEVKGAVGVPQRLRGMMIQR